MLVIESLLHVQESLTKVLAEGYHTTKRFGSSRDTIYPEIFANIKVCEIIVVLIFAKFTIAIS